MKNFFINYIYRLWDNRVKPIKAIKAIIALSKDNEDTTQVFHVIDALKGSSDRKYFKIFSKSEIGEKILKERVNLVDTLKDKEFLSKLPKILLAISITNLYTKKIYLLKNLLMLAKAVKKSSVIELKMKYFLTLEKEICMTYGT